MVCAGEACAWKDVKAMSSQSTDLLQYRGLQQGYPAKRRLRQEQVASGLLTCGRGVEQEQEQKHSSPACVQPMNSDTKTEHALIGVGMQTLVGWSGAPRRA